MRVQCRTSRRLQVVLSSSNRPQTCFSPHSLPDPRMASDAVKPPRIPSATFVSSKYSKNFSMLGWSNRTSNSTSQDMGRGLHKARSGCNLPATPGPPSQKSTVTPLVKCAWPTAPPQRAAPLPAPRCRPNTLFWHIGAIEANYYGSAKDILSPTAKPRNYARGVSEPRRARPGATDT